MNALNQFLSSWRGDTLLMSTTVTYIELCIQEISLGQLNSKLYFVLSQFLPPSNSPWAINLFNSPFFVQRKGGALLLPDYPGNCCVSVQTQR